MHCNNTGSYVCTVRSGLLSVMSNTATVIVYSMYYRSFSKISFFMVTMNSRDRYEIIGLRKISYFIKQPCRSTYLPEKSSRSASKLLEQC